MRIYVAGSSAELERAAAAMTYARHIGIEITHDWVADIRRTRVEGGRADHELTNHEQQAFARADLLGVSGADLVWLLVPETASTGAWVELGFALGWPTKVIASGERTVRNIFCSLASETFANDLDAGDYLRRLTE